MKILIPARFESTRFPGKPLIDLLGKSLIQRVYEKCSVISEKDTYVCTDDDRIYKHCLANNMKVLMTSNKCLTGTDRIYEASTNFDDDIFVNVQGDEPLISPDDILRVLKEYNNNVCCGMCNITNKDDFYNPSIPKVVIDKNKKLLYMSRAAIPTNKKLQFVKAKKQVCIYVFPKKALSEFGNNKYKSYLEEIEDIEILRFIELGYNIQMVDVSTCSVSIDHPSDVDRCINILKEQHNE